MVGVITRTMPDGTVVLDARTAVTGGDVRQAQRELAEWRLKGNATIHVAGELTGVDAADEMDAVGRTAVRLNISRIIAVGEGAHGIHRAAEHEGSWDGESLPVSTARSAYDELMPWLGEGTTVLVTGSIVGSLDGFVNFLEEVRT